MPLKFFLQVGLVGVSPSPPSRVAKQWFNQLAQLHRVRSVKKQRVKKEFQSCPIQSKAAIY